mmetsp:Transcript_8089/g.20146  ORF Transcript_8089/g.20146 Transcript_8089/m.20146 type:complete len:236 (+) Transcript_8089:938-1645(+)
MARPATSIHADELHSFSAADLRMVLYATLRAHSVCTTGMVGQTLQVLVVPPMVQNQTKNSPLIGRGWSCRDSPRPAIYLVRGKVCVALCSSTSSLSSAAAGVEESASTTSGRWICPRPLFSHSRSMAQMRARCGRHGRHRAGTFGGSCIAKAARRRLESGTRLATRSMAAGLSTVGAHGTSTSRMSPTTTRWFTSSISRRGVGRQSTRSQGHEQALAPPGSSRPPSFHSRAAKCC